MPQPTLGTVHTAAAMTQMAIGYGNPEFVLGNVFPTVRVQKESDYFYTWDKGPLFRDEARAVAPGGVAPRSGFTYSTTLYSTECYKFAWAIPDRIRNNMDSAISASLNATKRVMDKILLSREVTIGTLLSTTANWTTTNAAAVAWDADNSDPVADVFKLSAAVYALIGKPINTLVVPWKTYQKLLNNDAIVARILYGGTEGPKVLNEQKIASIFDVENLWVVSAAYDSAKEGQSSTTLTNPMSTTVWGGYVARSPALDEPSAGYVIQAGDPSVKSYREEKEEQDVIEGSLNFVAKVTLAGAGGTITGTTS